MCIYFYSCFKYILLLILLIILIVNIKSEWASNIHLYEYIKCIIAGIIIIFIIFIIYLCYLLVYKINNNVITPEEIIIENNLIQD
jgi:hypothetical protein